MTPDIKQYLKIIEQKDKKQYFLLYKFYLHPKKSLGDATTESLENYQNHGDIQHFLLNSYFFEFLSLCLQEPEFIQKLDNILLKKIIYILTDSKLHYKKFPLRKTISPLPISAYFQKNIQIQKDKIKLINTLLYTCYEKEIDYYENYIAPKLEKEKILNQIKGDNYQRVKTCFLYSRHGKDTYSFQYLICDNDFLEVIKSDLLPKQLPNIIIDHISEILEISINFKTIARQYEDFWKQYHRLGVDKINSYHYQEALSLLISLQEKKAQEPYPKQKILSKFSNNPNNKIVNFSSYQQ